MDNYIFNFEDIVKNLNENDFLQAQCNSDVLQKYDQNNMAVHHVRMIAYDDLV